MCSLEKCHLRISYMYLDVCFSLYFKSELFLPSLRIIISREIKYTYVTIETHFVLFKIHVFQHFNQIFTCYITSSYKGKQKKWAYFLAFILEDSAFLKIFKESNDVKF